MDLNVLSKLTSTPAVKQASGARSQGESGFEAAYKAEHSSDPASDPEKEELAGIDHADAAVADASLSKEKQIGVVREEATLAGGGAHPAELSAADDAHQANSTAVATTTEVEHGNIAAVKETRSSALGNASPTQVTKPVDSTQGAQDIKTSTPGLSANGAKTDAGNDLPPVQTQDGPSPSTVLTRESGARDSQVLAQPLAREPEAKATQATADPKGAEPASLSRTTGQQTASTQTVPPHSVDIDTTHSNSATGISTPPQAMSLLERHLGGHSVRLPLDVSQTRFSVREIRHDGGQPPLGMPSPPASATATLAATNGAMPTGLGSFGSGNTATARTQSSPLFVTELQASLTNGETPKEVVWDIRPGTIPTAGVAATAIHPRTDLAANVAHQMADAMRKATDKQVEIALSPAELGRVRMILSPTDAGVTMNILADRPETLELMRRNIDDLARSFAELGYEDISFSFGQNGRMTDDASHHPHGHDDQAETVVDWADVPAIPTESTSRLAIAPDGIDMRL